MKRAVIAAVGFIALGGTNAFASPAFASTTDVTELLATARVTGGVRVIVQVRVADGADAAAIAAAQDACWPSWLRRHISSAGGTRRSPISPSSPPSLPCGSSAIPRTS